MSQVFTIAEIAQAHEGSLGIAHSYIDALAETGVSAVKFQLHIAEAESSIYEKFRVNFSYEDKTRFEYWKRMEFTSEQWAGLKAHCEEKGVEFIASPFSNAAVELLIKLGVQKFKIGSGELSNWLMLDLIGRTKKEIIFSSGMSSLQELDDTIEFLKPFKNHVSVLQCTTAYPTEAGNWGLNVIPILKSRYGIPVGFSDHSGNIYACLAATALGADLLEFHAVFDKRMFGPDAKSSLEIGEICRLMEGVKQIRKDLEKPIDKNDTSHFTELKDIFEKSLVVNKTLKKGHILSIDDLEGKKPKNLGIDAKTFRRVLGKKLKVNLNKWDFLLEEHLDG